MKVAQNEGKFPVDAETLENLQNNTALSAALGAALGEDYVILTGCTTTGNRRAEGYVFVRLSADDPGEVLHFPGGNANEPNCYVCAEDIDITAVGEPYDNAYTSRTLVNGLPPHGEKKLAWDDFVTGSEIFAQKEHAHEIEDVQGLSEELNDIESRIAYANDATKTKVINKQIEYIGGGVHHYCVFPVLSNSRWSVAELKIAVTEHDGAASPIAYLGDYPTEAVEYNGAIRYPFAKQFIIPPNDNVKLDFIVYSGGMGLFFADVTAILQYRLI